MWYKYSRSAKGVLSLYLDITIRSFRWCMDPYPVGGLEERVEEDLPGINVWNWSIFFVVALE